VDEEARQKAVKRLEEDSERERKRLESAAKESITALKGKSEGDVDKRKAQREERADKLEEKLTAATEPLMKEAQALEKRIEERQGSQIRTPIVFESAKITIAETGETIGREHLTKLRKAVKARLDELKDKNAEERERALSKIDTDITTLKEGLATEIEAVETKLGEDVEAFQARVGAERDELMLLAQMQFLTETKYRELKSKWGQVFKADMGAEAFYDILARMDLESTAKELWREVKTSKSKQKRKKASSGCAWLKTCASPATGPSG